MWRRGNNNNNNNESEECRGCIFITSINLYICVIVMAKPVLIGESNTVYR